MKRMLLILCCCLGFQSLMAQSDEEVLSYIDRYKKLAIEEQLRTGVPASITLAQGIHESAAGKSELATQANNHFGIKCKSTWAGETFLHDDDKKQECFRKYISTEQSYIDHSDFLRNSNRYQFLFGLDITDYTGWASGLKRAGYATNPVYVKRLTDLVEKYNLQQYTYEAISKTVKPKGEVVPEMDASPALKSNDDPSLFYKGIKGFWAKKGEMLVDKAIEFNIRYAKLLAMNDLIDGPLPYDMFVFVERKRKTGTVEFHTVKAGESMQMISQKEAMLMDNLYSFNNLQPGDEPEVGEQLTLQYKAYGTPKLKPRFLNEIPRQVEVVKEEPAVKPVPVPQHLVVDPKPAETPVKVAIETPVQEEKKVEEPVKVVVTETPQVQVAEEKKIVEPAVVTETPAAPIMEEKKVEEPVKVVVIETPKVNTQVETPKVAVEEKLSEEPVVLTQQPVKKKDTIVTIVKPDGATEVVKPVEVNVAPVEAIIDNEKARRTEALLADKTEIKPQEIIAAPPAVVLQQSIQAIPPKPKKPEYIELNRKYDEAGVDDSVKSLKKRFDQVIYRPLPERKKIETAKSTDPAAKTKTTAPVKEQPRTVEDDKQKLQVTSTGLKREFKKEVAKAPEAKDPVKKEAAKKPDPKAKTAAKKPDPKTAAAKMKADAKKATDKKAADKKTTDKKAADAKKKAAAKKKK